MNPAQLFYYYSFSINLGYSLCPLFFQGGSLTKLYFSYDSLVYKVLKLMFIFLVLNFENLLEFL